MTFPKARLIVSACLFLAWLGFLLFLIIDARRITISTPQFEIAQLCVVVDVNDQEGHPDPTVTVDEVLWALMPADQQLAKKSLLLPDLLGLGRASGYRDAGKYVVPLIKTGPGAYAIAPLPRTAYPRDQVRIYPWTPDVRVQVERLIGAKK
jgi:hypothetical protein